MHDTIKRIIDEQCGFITAKDKEELMPIYADMQVLVRTGANRYLCALSDIEKVFVLVGENGDYVRDVSLTSKQCEAFQKNGVMFTTREVIQVHKA